MLRLKSDVKLGWHPELSAGSFRELPVELCGGESI